MVYVGMVFGLDTGKWKKAWEFGHFTTFYMQLDFSALGLVLFSALLTRTCTCIRSLSISVSTINVCLVLL